MLWDVYNFLYNHVSELGNVFVYNILDSSNQIIESLGYYGGKAQQNLVANRPEYYLDLGCATPCLKSQIEVPGQADNIYLCIIKFRLC